MSRQNINVQWHLLIYFVSAKFEAQDNDLPPSIPFRISGFPTLKFKRAGSRDFIDYDGDRSFESLVSFIEEHAKNSLALPEIEEPKVEEPKTEEPKREEPKTNEAQVPLEVVTHEEL